MRTLKQFLLLPLFLVVALGLHAQDVSFTLLNRSLQSIPLVIPTVMNPNLSPMSSSGVGARVGTKIFFIHKKKRYLLLVVTEAIAGQKLVVDDLIKARKKELGLE